MWNFKSALTDRQINGPSAFYDCVNRQLRSLRRAQLSTILSASERSGRTSTKREGTLGAAPQEPTQAPTSGPQGSTRVKTPALATASPTFRQGSGNDASTGRESPRHQPAPQPVVQERSLPPGASPNPRSDGGSPRAQAKESDSWMWLAGWLSFLGVTAARRLVQRRRRSCPKCGASMAGTVCSQCLRASAEASARAEAESEAKRRAEEEQRRKEERRRAHERLRSVEDLNRLTGAEFEDLIGSLFVEDGYAVDHCGASGDEGIDLVLRLGNSKDVVQCKRWKADIGSPVVRDFYGALMHAGARHGFIITTASFTVSARSFAVGKPITLLDGFDIIRWLEGHYSSQWNSRQRSDSANRSADSFDPYAVLGVPRTATKDEIRAAYRDRMAKYHPDKVTHLGDELQELARTKALALNRAYEILNR